MAPSDSKKRRRAITDAERKALREYFHSCDSKPSGKAMRQWFQDQFHHLPSESTVSAILSKKYGRLGEEIRFPASKKSRMNQWPDLELSLFEWQQRMQNKEATITGDILKRMAEVFWKRLPQYADVEMPKFSNGWLEGFKKRYRIRKYVRHGDAGSVNLDDVESQLMEIREMLAPYDNDDIYNMDESALYWKASPDATLATESTPGGKSSKARITINLCCNSTGNHRLLPWYIGTSMKPRCFSSSGINIENLPMKWRNNKKGWMTAAIMKEYILWFDQQMHGRNTILLMDNFSAHLSGFELIMSDENLVLRNVKVVFLPPNATSVCQPLDQGIIRAWKAHYRSKWLIFVCKEYDNDRDPEKTMNVLQAIRWGNTSWIDDLTNNTIHNCWVKSRVLGPQYGPMTEEMAKKEGWKDTIDQKEDSDQNTLILQMQISINHLASTGRIRQAINVDQFLNPLTEQIEEDEEDIVDHLVECYGKHEDRDHETDEEDIATARITYNEALRALNILRLHEEQQVEGNIKLISQLNGGEKVMKARYAANAQQQGIRNYLL